MTQGLTHLTPGERSQIEVLLRRGDSKRAIGRLLGRPPSTIRREIKRNSGQRGYRPKQAQAKAEERRATVSRRPTKMTPGMVALIEAKLTGCQWSPEQISGRMKLEAKGDVSHERIYAHVWADKRAGGGLYKHLRHGAKKYNKRKGKTSGRGLIPGRVDIDQRPRIVDAKSRLGDWEVDTVIGAKHKGALVTAIDRASKFTVIEAVPNKTSEAVTKALTHRLGAFADRVLTLTADNVLRAESALESSHDVSDCKIAPAASFWSTQIRDKPKARRLPRVMEKISSIANTGSRKRLALTVLNTSF